MSDGGLYVCVASNIAGNLTQTVELSVLGKIDTQISLPPQLKERMDSRTIADIKNHMVLSLISSTCSYSGWSQSDEGAGGSRCGAALCGSWCPRAHTNLD